MTAPFSLKTQEKMGCSPRRNEPPLTCFHMCVRESGASSSAKHQSNTQHQATLSAGAACFFVAPAGKRSSCKRESLALGMLANLRCTSGRSTCIRLRCVLPFINRWNKWEDSFCGPACIVAFNAKMRAEHDESLAWLEVGEEPPEPPAPMPIRRREGEPDAETGEPQATADTVFESVLVKPRVAVGRQRRPVVSDR